MLHLVHLPSGRIIQAGEPIEAGLVRLADATTLTSVGTYVPCVRLRDDYCTYSWVEGTVFRDYQVIGD